MRWNFHPFELFRILVSNDSYSLRFSQEKIWLDFGESRGEVKGIGKFFLKIIKDSFKLKIGYEEISSLLNRVFKKSNVKIINNKERWYRILVDAF